MVTSYGGWPRVTLGSRLMEWGEINLRDEIQQEEHHQVVFREVHLVVRSGRGCSGERPKPR